MTLQEAYNTIFAYIKAQAGATACVQAFGNGPTPKAPYIAVTRISAQPIGTAETHAAGAATVTESVRTQYEGSLSVYAVAPPNALATASDMLRAVFAMVHSTSAKLYFAQHGLAVLSVQGPEDMPRNNDQSFVDEAVSRVRVAFSDTVTAVIQKIEHSTITGTVSDSTGGTVDVTITT